MTITLLRGTSGSGKSRHLIKRVNEAVAEGRNVATVVCRDFPWPSGHGAFLVNRYLVCREDGVTCPLDHFVTDEELRHLLAAAPTGTLVAIDEAYAFGGGTAHDWIAASRRGVDLLVAAPSYHQTQALAGHEHSEIEFHMTCERCGEREGLKTTISAESNQTLTVCGECFDALRQDARVEIVRCLREEEPFPGEDGMYQPVELPELATWRLARPDSPARAAAVARLLQDEGVWPTEANATERSYLDVGCNTGFFCNYFASRGFRAKGVDATKRFITVARLMDSFYRRETRPNMQFVQYEHENAYEYLQKTQDELFDVTSAFAIFQWVMVQRDVEHGLQCIEWLGAKTRSVCVLEMGYTNEDMYKGQIDVVIDREWVIGAMKERGGFDDIRVLNAKTDGLQRDVFIGVRSPAPPAID